MKRLIPLLLALSLLCACARTQTETEKASARTLQFYYRTAETYYGTSSGVIAAEPRQVPPSATKDLILALYLQGPLEDNYISPFPENLTIDSCNVEGDVAYVTLGDAFLDLTGVDRTIAEACLVRTIAACTGVQSVSLQSETEELYTGEDFLLEDSDVQTQGSIRLYFSAGNSRYLNSETRKTAAEGREALALDIMEQLIEGPSGALLPTIPEGTSVLSVTLSENLCTVNLSRAFLENAPQTELEERMTVYSIVNSLTGVEDVDAVQILVEGEKVARYRYLDLSSPIARYEDAIGPVRPGLNEFDATLYMVQEGQTHLSCVPVAIHQPVNKTQLEALMDTLLGYTPATGFFNPIPSGTKLLSLTLVGQTCYVDFSPEITQTGGSRTQDAACVRCIVATLCARPEIDRVQILVGGEAAGFAYDISKPLTSYQKWFYQD